MVKLNISYPPYSSSQLIEVDDEKKWRIFLDKRLSEEVPADPLGEEFKGYVFKITGGYDKEGFAMMQGVMLNHRTRLLLNGQTGQYTPKRPGCRKRKSVRGCIVGTDMSCINLMIVKRGPVDLPKLTDKASDRPSIRGPKRADNIRKAWGLTKKEDVRQYVMKKLKPGKEGKRDRIKSPKIQRLITPVVKQRRKRLMKARRLQKEKSRKEAADYANLLKQIRAQRRMSLLSKRREARSSKVSATTSQKTSTVLVSDKKKTAATKTKIIPKSTQKVVTGKPKTGAKGIQKPKILAAKKATTTTKKVIEKKPSTTPTQKKSTTAEKKSETKKSETKKPIVTTPKKTATKKQKTTKKATTTTTTKK